MGLWKFWRKLIVLDWLFGGHRSDTSANQPPYTSYDRDCECDCDNSYGLSRSSDYSGSSWRNSLYGNDYCDDCDRGLYDGINSDFDNFDNCDTFDNFDNFDDDF